MSRPVPGAVASRMSTTVSGGVDVAFSSSPGVCQRLYQGAWPFAQYWRMSTSVSRAVTVEASVSGTHGVPSKKFHL